MNEQPVRIWDQSEKAWFDKEGAEDHAISIAKSDDDRETLLKFVRDGYFVIDGLVANQEIDDILDDVKDIWDADRPREMTINRVNMNGEFRPSVHHREITALPLEERRKIKSESNFTFGDIHPASAPIMKVFKSPEIKRVASLLFQGEAEPRNSLYFEKGSQQNIHQDSAVFHVHPAHYFVGAWLALEDIADDSGPLQYYPGSHKMPVWSEFPNYPQDNLRTVADKDSFRRYDEYLADASKNYEKKVALLKKGQILFWHGQLIHGGTPVTRADATRKSLVIHIMKEGTDKQPEMVGPFNW